MDNDNLFVWGDPIQENEITVPEIRELAQATKRYPFTQLLGVRRKTNEEGVVIEFQVELPQYPLVPILPREHIVIALSHQDTTPSILALRKDFPETLHQNLTPLGEPKDLCLFEEYYPEISAQLTPMMLIQQVSSWLARAAVEELHLSDQPLEPLLLNSGRIIFDVDVFDFEKDKLRDIVMVLLSDQPTLLRAFTSDFQEKVGDFPAEKSFLLLPVSVPPWHSRIIHHTPRNLFDLCHLLNTLGLNLEEQIRDYIHGLHKRTEPEWLRLQQYRLVILLSLPKTRFEGGPIESQEYWAFIIPTSIAELGIRLGILGRHNGRLGVILGSPASESLEEIYVEPLRPTFALSKPFARRLSGLGDRDPRIVAIGAGALGSQVILNLARQGYGYWSIVDYDLLLPHNLVRHGLHDWYIGRNKAEALAIEVTSLLNEKKIAIPFPRDILQVNNQPKELIDALQSCDLILDFSTSRAVVRSIALADYTACRTSVFLSSNGRYLIILSEGQERNVRLDDLEQQLAAFIAENSRFHDIYLEEKGVVRYAGSCRDESAQLAQDTVAVHGAVASKFIKTNAFAVEPSINIWEYRDDDFTIHKHAIPVSLVSIFEVNGWTIRISSHAMHLIRYNRRKRLPNETGGILLGKIDYKLRTVYIATILPSPPDSVEWPTLYIRGVEGLQRKVEEIFKATGGDLSYVGEWHSHPDGYSKAPSQDDLEAHKQLMEKMGFEGLPGLIVIQGENAVPEFLIGLAA